MIDDESRTAAYCDAIEKNSSYFRGKVVADVGCGSGILSLFAARAGAKKVYAIECTNMYKIAMEIIKDNHFEHIITVVVGEAEKIELPEKVDIIVSEWMGYSLYFEVMLPSVLSVRDRFLKPDGYMLPSNARLYLSLCEATEFRCTTVDFWDNTYGFNFSAMKKIALQEPVIETFYRDQIIASSCTISNINTKTCLPSCVFFKSPFEIRAYKNETMHGFVTWFDVDFASMSFQNRLSTSPYNQETHWRQTMFPIAQPIQLNSGDILKGTFETKPHPEDGSGLVFIITYNYNGGEEMVQHYSLK